MNTYIIASSQSWHRTGFEEYTKHKEGVWEYVGSKKELEKSLLTLHPRYIFFLHWNWMVPNSISEKYECICFHMTDVPYGRGGSPLQNLIMEGQTHTKVSALRMVQEMDAGPIYCKREMPLDGTAEEIYLRAGRISWDIIDWIINNNPVPVPQTGMPTFFKRRRPEQSELPQGMTLTQTYDFIRMLDAPSYPKAFIIYGNHRIELSAASISDKAIRASVEITINQPESKEIGLE